MCVLGLSLMALTLLKVAVITLGNYAKLCLSQENEVTAFVYLLQGENFDDNITCNSIYLFIVAVALGFYN